jgi:hypothetical protein
MVYLTGYGFPLHRGGPMCYADQVGLFNVVQAMKRFARNPHDDASSGSRRRCWRSWRPKARPSPDVIKRPAKPVPSSTTSGRVAACCCAAGLVLAGLAAAGGQHAAPGLAPAGGAAAAEAGGGRPV